MIRNIDEVLEAPVYLKPSDEIVVYGTGLFANYVARKLKSLNILPVAFCDTHRVGEEFQGHKIRDIKDVVKEYDGNLKVLIASQNFYQEIKGILLEHFPEENIIQPYGAECIGFKEFVAERKDEFNDVLNLLSDDTSKEILLKVLTGRVTVDFEWFKQACEEDQYFVKGLVKFTDNETFVDCGAFTGDTLDDFIKHTDNKFEKAFCFEPSDTTFVELQKTLEKHHGDERIKLYKGGLYSETTQLGFDEHDLSAGNSIDTKSENLIDVYAIDEVINERVSFIKMDVEGAELDALKGARETILKYKPKLAISIYHKFEDYLEIPKYINSLGLNYRFYIRHHTECQGDTILYAI